MAKEFSLLLFAFLVLSGIGVGWLAMNDIQSGNIYSVIFLMTSVMMLIGFLIKGESQVGDIIKAPFSTSYNVSVGMYFLGAITPVIVNGLLSLGNIKFSVAQAMIPLSTTTINNEILQNFSAVQTSLDPFWQLFITVFTAGTIEEFAWGYSFMVIFYLLATFVLKMLNNGNDLSFMKKETFYVWFAIVFSGFTFMGTHALNNTYVGAMFLVALIFRSMMNILIYLGGAFLSFTMGYHHINNFIYFIDSFGVTTTINALFGLKGLAIVTLYMLLLTYLIRNWKNVWSETFGVIFGR